MLVHLERTANMYRKLEVSFTMVEEGRIPRAQMLSRVGLEKYE